MGLSQAEVRPLVEPADLDRALAVVQELRPHLDREALLAAVARQADEGYRAIGLFEGECCLGFAGYRVQHMLAHGRLLYVDDLVVTASRRGSGAGAMLIGWLEAEARRCGCASLQLDSGTHRHGAHAFYFARGLRIASFHFSRELDPA